MAQKRQNKSFQKPSFQAHGITASQERWGVLVALVLFVGIFGILPAVSFSQTAAKLPRPITFELKSKAKLVRAYGIVSARELPTAVEPEEAQSEITAGKLSSIRRQADIQQLGADMWTVTVNLTHEEASKEGSIMVVALTNEGRTITSDVRNLSPSGEEETIIGSCTEQSSAQELQTLVALPEKRLKILLRIRQDHYELLHEEFKERLDNEALTLLRQKEQELNLTYQTPLTQDLPLDELAMRIGTIAALLDTNRTASVSVQ